MNPNNINPAIVPGGWFGTLAKKYPQAVKKAAMGGQNNPSVLQSERKFEYAAEAQGWHVVDFQVPPITVTDWSPYIQDLQSKGVEADWPSADANIAPYLQSMATAGYNPAFLSLGVQYYNQATAKAVASVHAPPIYIATSWWPLEMASKNPSTEQLVRVMHTYGKGDTIDFDDEEGTESWLLWAKSASACGANLTVSCVLSHAASEKNWSAGGLQAPVAQLTASNANPVPSPCFAMLQAEPNKFVYNKALTQPTQSIWNCNPKNNVHLTPQQVTSLGTDRTVAQRSIDLFEPTRVEVIDEARHLKVDQVGERSNSLDVMGEGFPHVPRREKGEAAGVGTAGRADGTVDLVFCLHGHPAVGVRNDHQPVDAEQGRSQDQGAEHVVGHPGPRVAQDLGVPRSQSQHPQWIDPRVHAGEDRESPACSTLQVGISIARAELFVRL